MVVRMTGGFLEEVASELSKHVGSYASQNAIGEKVKLPEWPGLGGRSQRTDQPHWIDWEWVGSCFQRKTGEWSYQKRGKF